ncbi:MAG: hypothetical protein R3B92_04425 [Patescibacteria group bacterium]|uniref:Deoxynucleoside kinase domain-containing protein n=1 Tax=candidate division WWE3 bacterium TaxID=2053526 RepID=A0A955EDG7_UNCKA|nr:hypothetical protein [candidate division WWE3 bacterium]
MIVFVEGLPCVGKTTWLNSISNTPSISVVPEFLLSYEPTKYTSFDSYCYHNDIAKCKLAKELSVENKVVFVDRSYISTISFDYGRYMLLSSYENYLKYILCWKWLYSSLDSNKIQLPDVIVLLTFNEESRLKRLHKVFLDPLDPRTPSMSNPFYACPDKVITFYDIFKESFKSVDFVKLDSSTINQYFAALVS